MCVCACVCACVCVVVVSNTLAIQIDFMSNQSVEVQMYGCCVTILCDFTSGELLMGQYDVVGSVQHPTIYGNISQTLNNWWLICSATCVETLPNGMHMASEPLIITTAASNVSLPCVACCHSSSAHSIQSLYSCVKLILHATSSRVHPGRPTL